MSRLLVMLLALSFVACPAPAKQTGPKPITPDPNAPPHEQVVTLFEGLAAELTAAQANCESVAKLLNGWTAANRARYPELSGQAAAAQLSSEDRLRHEDRLRTALLTVVDTAASCTASANASAAFSAFDALVDPR